MGRPKLGRETCNITLPPALVKAIDQYAADTGRTRSEVLQHAAESFLAHATVNTSKRPGKAKAGKP
jgi:metal-responsive CopG/Arc/MetJ family transcriptional regulator